jgi:hypothetical protein
LVTKIHWLQKVAEYETDEKGKTFHSSKLIFECMGIPSEHT